MLKSIVVGGVIGIVGVLAPMAVHAQFQAPAVSNSGQVQQEVSTLELRQYAQIIRQFQVLDQKTQQEMGRAIAKEGLEPKRFMEIGKNLNSRTFNAETKPSLEEMEKFQKALPIVEEIVRQSDLKKERMIVTQGLDVKRYRQIESTVEQNRDLQQKVKTMIEN